MSVSDFMRCAVGLAIMLMNIAAVLVLLRCKKMPFQIRIFTIQLALADLLSGLTLVFIGLRLAALSPVTCRINFHFTSALHFVSTITITSMSGDRFLAICVPFRYHRMVTAKRVKFLGLLEWIVSMIISLVFLAWRQHHESTNCNYIELNGENGYRLLAVLYIGVLFLNILFFCGIVSALCLRKNAVGSFNNNGRDNHMKEHKTILMKILGILGLFLLTYVPGIIMSIALGIDYSLAEYTTLVLVTGKWLEII